MSDDERLSSYLDRITDLCFSISELRLKKNSEGEVAKPSTSASVLSPEAPAFTPASKGKERVSGDQESKPAVSEDWESVPVLPSESVSLAPSYSQVVGSSSQKVFVTPVKRTAREQSVESAESAVTMAAPPVPPAPPPPPPVAPNFANCTGPQFEAYWQALGTDPERIAAETLALTFQNAPVTLVVLTHQNERNQARIANLNNALGRAQNQIAAANANAVARAAAPSKFENKESGPDIRQWLPMIEEYLNATPNAEYLRIASSYLNGKPRSFWMSTWEAWQAANPGAYPGSANPGPFVGNARAFFRETMIRGYGLRTPIQSYWDTWNKLSQGSKSVDEYNVEFNQAMVNLREEITDEAVKIEKYRSGLQADIREMCRTAPNGQRWATLNDIGEYATLMWPIVAERLAKRKSSQPAKSVAGKRKASGGGGSGRSSKAKLSAALTDEQYANDMENRLCHKCHKPGHIARDCDEDVPSGSQSKGKGQKKGNKKSEKGFQKD